MHLDYDENGKYSKNRVPLVDLKRVMTEWQDKMYENDGWNSLYWSNHDQARAVFRFGNDSEKYRVISAKMLGTCLHMMQGTPYVYEGEELGMTNADFTEISEYRDLEALDIYKDFTERKGENESLLVVCNFTDRTIGYPVKEYLNGAEGKLVISNYEDAAATVTDELVLPPYGAYICRF